MTQSATSPGTHLVTGATGFIGAAVVLELLERTRDDIVAIVRPGKTSAEDRFRDAIGRAAEAYASPVDLPSALARCRVVAGDIAREGCGVEAPNIGAVAQVWHCAASLRYEDRYAAEIHATNVEGTRHVLAFSSSLGAETFNYVSTAYVAGRSTGVIREQPLPGVPANNCYEASKQEAERIVLATVGPRVRVFRPSVVVGHSRTLAATTFSGYYGFVRQLMQFRGMIERVQAGLLGRTSLLLRIDSDAAINLVPVDKVAREAVAIALMPTSEGVFHLTHRSPPGIGLAIRTVFAMLGLHEPTFVRDADELGWLDSRLDQRLEFYRSYITADRRFDRSRTDAALGATQSTDAEYDGAAIAALGRWYLARLEAQRAALPVAR